jgi:hypothetical protein
MRPVFDSEVDQKGQMFSGAKSDRVAVGRNESGLTQATEKPLRVHSHLAVTGVFQSMQALQLTVNNLQPLLLSRLTICNEAPPVFRPCPAPGFATNPVPGHTFCEDSQSFASTNKQQLAGAESTMQGGFTKWCACV